MINFLVQKENAYPNACFGPYPHGLDHKNQITISFNTINNICTPNEYLQHTYVIRSGGLNIKMCTNHYFFDTFTFGLSSEKMASKEFSALEQKDIQPGDYVSTPFRGGSRQGYVKEIVKSKEEAMKNPTVTRQVFTVG
ncbi:113_t:CDS:2 [Gigaspora margarita]|uniref:113_t:CDS:1 n=1 Tax=Gigaspora margarita TaxID=4874 RepID=A0ABN7UDD5_GIGMA|nr:113_t:CDS:2 [Gigaspora margarita]